MWLVSTFLCFDYDITMQDLGDDGMSENDSDDEHVVSSEEYTSESDTEDENDEEGASNAETKSDAIEDEEIDLQASAEVLEKLIPFSLKDFENVMSFVKSLVFLM